MSNEQTKRLHAFHKSLQSAVTAALRWSDSLDTPNLPDTLKEKFTTILTRLSTAKTMAEASFPDAIVSSDTGPNDGPVALVEYNADTQSAKLFVHGICLRSVGTQVEIAAIRRQAELVNIEAAKS